jgi:hypothetical protein
MSDMKCPFCQQELDTGRYYVHCHNPECDITVEMEGTEEMWEALIRTRKALDVAVDALKEYANEDNWGIGFTPWSEDGTRDALYTEDGYKKAKQALEQITALEQKDVK